MNSNKGILEVTLLRSTARWKLANKISRAIAYATSRQTILYEIPCDNIIYFDPDELTGEGEARKTKEINGISIIIKTDVGLNEETQTRISELLEQVVSAEGIKLISLSFL